MIPFRSAPRKICRLHHKLLLPVAAMLYGLGLLSSNLQALESDRHKSINIQADHAELSELNGRAVYTGKVELTQGSLNIRCDVLVVHTENGAVNKVEATGAPANYMQQLDNNQPVVEAEAVSIVYLPANEKVLLQQSAKLRQGNNIFEGDQIEYDLHQQRLSASQNPKKPLENSTGKRVRMTLQPQTTPSDSAAQP